MLEIIKINSPKYPIKIALKELEEMFSTSIIKPTYIIAEKEKKILGFAGYIPSWADNMVFNMFWLNTHPEYQNQGIASELIKERIKLIKQEKTIKAKMIIISTKKLKFAKKFGFKKITNPYDGDYILMALDL